MKKLFHLKAVFVISILILLNFSNYLFGQTYWTPSFAWTVFVNSPQDDFDFQLHPNTVNMSSLQNFDSNNGDYIKVQFSVQRKTSSFPKALYSTVATAYGTFSNGVDDVFTISSYTYVYANWLKYEPTPSCTYYLNDYRVVSQLYAITNNGNNTQQVSNKYFFGLFSNYDSYYFIYGYEYICGIDKINNSEKKVTNSIKENALNANYPNPFNPSTQISYQIPIDGFVSLVVYNSLGQEVAKLVNKHQTTGKYSVVFNASNLPSGVYIYSLRINDFVKNNKMTLLK